MWCFVLNSRHGSDSPLTKCFFWHKLLQVMSLLYLSDCNGYEIKAI